MQLFYNPNIDKDTQQITFNKEESRHIVKVLRKKEGDTVYLTDGKGYLYTSKINIANDKKCLATIFGATEKELSRDYKLHVAIAPTKNNDRLEWFLEKATEIGIDEITPIITQNSERRVIKKERMEKIIQSAMKQALKFHLPRLNDAIPFSEFLNQKFEKKVYIAHCEEGEKKGMKELIQPKESLTILIGPEGDFSSEEIGQSLNGGCIPISLGKARLRTETAAVVAVQNVAFINQ